MVPWPSVADLPCMRRSALAVELALVLVAVVIVSVRLVLGRWSDMAPVVHVLTLAFVAAGSVLPMVLAVRPKRVEWRTLAIALPALTFLAWLGFATVLSVIEAAVLAPFSALIFFALVTILLAADRARCEVCNRCNDDLLGNASGTCSECGVVLAPNQRTTLRSRWRGPLSRQLAVWLLCLLPAVPASAAITILLEEPEEPRWHVLSCWAGDSWPDRPPGGSAKMPSAQELKDLDAAIARYQGFEPPDPFAGPLPEVDEPEEPQTPGRTSCVVIYPWDINPWDTTDAALERYQGFVPPDPFVDPVPEAP